ncbi:MAG TPA: hypothetical protein VER04_26180, partial [Polyangiaceae bacterium]|nr:hypothetical protein [Polyangiaceae bacterium]
MLRQLTPPRRFPFAPWAPTLNTARRAGCALLAGAFAVAACKTNSEAPAPDPAGSASPAPARSAAPRVA